MAVKIFPSILSADYANIEHDLCRIGEAGADGVHLDVMDANFVPNLTFGWGVIESMRKKSKLFFDAHLMIASPGKWVDNVASAGADAIVFHYEACHDLHEARKILKAVRAKKKMPGISVKPATPVHEIFPLIEEKLVDYALVMTVEPGFGGQKFMEDCARKVWELSKFTNKHSLNTWIGVDGGITKETAETARDYGANLLVSGTTVFREKTEKGMRDVMDSLRGKA